MLPPLRRGHAEAQDATIERGFPPSLSIYSFSLVYFCFLFFPQNEKQGGEERRRKEGPDLINGKLGDLRPPRVLRAVVRVCRAALVCRCVVRNGARPRGVFCRMSMVPHEAVVRRLVGSRNNGHGSGEETETTLGMKTRKSGWSCHVPRAQAAVDKLRGVHWRTRHTACAICWEGFHPLWEKSSLGQH